MTNIYEIYTKHPETGEGGWDIVFVRCKPEHIESYPNFDCIITVNDYPSVGQRHMSAVIDWRVS